MDFSKSIYWRGVPPFARAASPRLRFASFTTPSPSLSPFRTHAPMCLPFCSCAAPPPGLRSAPHCPHTLRANSSARRSHLGCIVLVPCTSFACVRPSPCTHLFSGAACNPGGLGTRGGGWAERTDPLASPGVSRRGGGRKRRAGVARAEEDWAVRAVPPLACVGGAGLDAPSVLLRTRAGRGAWGWAGVARAEGWAHRPSSCECGRVAWGWAGVARAEEGWAVRAVPPLACVGGAGMDALSVLLRTRAGRGAWGWAGVARAKGWAHRPSSRVCGQGGAGEGPGRRALMRTLSARMGQMLGREGPGAAGPRDRGGPDMGEGPARPLSACEGTVAVNAGDRVGERLTAARDAGRGGVLVLGRRDVMGMGPVLDPVAEASRACHVSYWVHSFPLAHPFADARGQADTPPLPLHRAPPFVRRKRCTMGRVGPSPVSGPPRSRGPAAPGPSLPNICPIRAERVRMRARRPGPSLQAHGGQRAHPSPLRRRRRLPSPTRPAPPCPHTREEGRCAHPFARATPAQPHAPRPARVRKRTDSASIPAPPTHARGGTARTAQPSSARATPAQPHATRPHSQEEGRCAHPSARATPAQPHAPRPARVRKRTDGASSPAPPTHARGGTARTAQSSSARATPARRLRPPPRLLTPGDARGSVRSAQPPPRVPSPPGLHAAPEKRCVHGEGRTHAKEVHGTRTMQPKCERRAEEFARRVCGQCGAERNPGGGAAHEQKGRHIGAWVRKGESDGEGVVNEAKRSRGEAARANGGTPRQ
ncbi:hypothetical protein EDB83DRAFT_2547873 [Lactarius deliciosus]|nr:hypothetical protein EDB83DRAFT_2547873 [Lactarius deliciosus]